MFNISLLYYYYIKAAGICCREIQKAWGGEQIAETESGRIEWSEVIKLLRR